MSMEIRPTNSASPTAPAVLIVMGVSGSGKSTRRESTSRPIGVCRLTASTCSIWRSVLPSARRTP